MVGISTREASLIGHPHDDLCRERESAPILIACLNPSTDLVLNRGRMMILLKVVNFISFIRFSGGIIYSFFMQRTALLALLFILVPCMQQPVQAQSLTNGTQIEITKAWSQEPGGWTYPMSISVPDGPAPDGGHPVCILLHGNGGNGQGTIPQFSGLLPCHALVAPSGYQSSWNICAEQSDAPDVEMVGELITRLQGFSNVDPDRIRILGFSNGSALANRVFIENDTPGLDAVCAVVSQLTEGQYHDGTFHRPAGTTSPGASYCGYDTPKVPIAGRRYLSICNFNDGVIPYDGGESGVGATFISAPLATFLIARTQGYDGPQLTSPGEPIGEGVFKYAYLDGRVVHLRGPAGHGMNGTEEQFIPFFLEDCEIAPECEADLDDDGVVGGADLSRVLSEWGQSAVPPGSGADLNGDGVISGPDLAQILGFWGQCAEG